MKPSRIVVFAAVALCALQTFATHTEVTKVPRLPFLRGVGFDGYYGGRDRSYFKQADLFTKLVAHGFDHVRLPVDFRDYSTFDASNGVATLSEKNSAGFTNFGWTSGVGFSTFDSLITNAINAGLYITLDFHGWFDLDPSDAAQTNQFISLWKAVAERYKDYPNQLIFELANEPQNRGWTGICNLQKNAIKEIRKTNPTRLILFDQVDGSQPWVFPEGWPKLPTDDNNFAIAVHCYNPYDFTTQGAWGSDNQTTPIPLDAEHRATLEWDLLQCHNWLKETGVPIVLNEFGVSHKEGMTDRADVTEFYSIITSWCEKHNVPWAPWSYYEGGVMDVTDGNGNVFDFVKDGLFPGLKLTSEFSASDYAHKIEITFSGYAGSSTLANFPVLVKLSESLTGFHYSDFTRADGFDLCFNDSSGNLIPHEIDTWNPSGVSTVWVKVPSLTKTTKIVARYGCTKPIVPKVESVWDSNYVAVWHMGEPKLPLADSSNASRDLTASDGSGIGYGVSGVAGGAVDFGSAGGSRGLFADDHMNLDGHAKLTVEAWTYQKAHGTNAGIVSKRKSSGNQASYYLYDNGSTTTFQVSSNGTAAVSAGVNLSPVAGRWNHQAYTIDTTASANNAAGYLDGTRVGTATAAVKGPVFAGTGELCIGNLQSGNAANFPGRIDEVRISKCVRSADWVKASYDTVAKASFATYAVDGVVSSAAPEEQGANLVPDDLIEYGQLDQSAFAKKITVAFSGYSGAALADFPVLVKLSSAIDGFSYADFQKPKGGDLRFADANGTLLPHEIDTWNTNGVSTVWVKVPSLSANGTITACYGCANPPAVNAKDVWDDDYVGVWHLNEGGLPLCESSRRGPSFTMRNGQDLTFASSGVVGKSVDFGNGLSNAVIAVDHDNLDGFEKFTIEAWTKQASHKAAGGILSKRETYNLEASYWFYDKDGKTMLRATTNGTSGVDCIYTIAPPLNQWNHQVYSFDTTTASSNLKGYLNGAAAGTVSKAFGKIYAGIGWLTLGNLQPDAKDNSFNGSIDEVRISKCVRSADWIKATHDTVANANFATYTFDISGLDDPELEPTFAKEVTVAFTGYSGAALANFPVLVRLSTAIPGFSYTDFQADNGGDLRFFDSDGNLLSHEIDTWNPSGVSTVWVKVPTLNASTAIIAKYGCANPPAVNAKDVWDADYLGVWHLGAASGVSAQPDSTANGKDFGIHTNNSNGVASGADGIVGRSAETGIRTDGKGCFFQSDADKLFVNKSAFTVETWTWQDDHEPVHDGDLRYVLAHSGGNEKSYDWRIYENNKGKLVMQFYSLGSLGESDAKIFADDGATRPARAQWNHTAFAWDGSSGQLGLYLGGNPLGIAASVLTNNWTGTMNGEKTGFNLGNHRYDNTKSFKGRIDEVRISKVARSAAWIKATHDTIANADFATYTGPAGAMLSGFARWIAGKGLTGSDAAFDKETNGIKNGVRYAFDIDPATSEIGTPIIQVVRDANGNPSVQSRDLATGRDDVIFGILATPDLTDWSNATLVPMTKFATDGLWRPTASESSGYVFPSQMFFKYKIDIQQ